MKTLTIIGSGNAFNTDGRAHACYLLEETGGQRLLLDLGATSLYRLQQERIDLNSIDLLLLTHFHGDHFMGLPFLLIQMGLVDRRQKPFTIAGPAGVQERCQQLLELAYPGMKYSFPIAYQEIPVAGCTIDAFQIRPFPVTHQPESLGYRITGGTGKTIAFSGDAMFDEKLFRLMEGVDLGLMEVSMLEQTDPPVVHVAVDELEKGIQELKAKRLVFTHLFDRVAVRLQESGLGEVAADGMVFYL